MAQPQNHVNSTMVKQVIDLLTNGNSNEWKQIYRKKHFHEELMNRCAEAYCMDFDYSKRNHFYKFVHDQFIKGEPIDYLEFGVAGGESMRCWVDVNKSPHSRFYGFDSFEGLPEDWNCPKGTFTQGGNAPDIGDDRVTFINGLFQDTLDAFSKQYAPENRLVMHMDADLYSSTLYALMNFDRHIENGTIIFFDEFTARSCTDEFAAMQDYCEACYRDYKIIATRSDHVKLAVEITK